MTSVLLQKSPRVRLQVVALMELTAAAVAAEANVMVGIVTST
jgi:hypothetical protein